MMLAYLRGLESSAGYWPKFFGAGPRWRFRGQSVLGILLEHLQLERRRKSTNTPPKQTDIKVAGLGRKEADGKLAGSRRGLPSSGDGWPARRSSRSSLPCTRRPEAL